MGLILFLYPLFEVMSLILFGRAVGFGMLFVYLIGSFIIGMSLIRSAGFSSSLRPNPEAIREVPFRLMAGVLILIPGLISDLLAILVLIPWVRKILWLSVFSRVFKGKIQHQVWQFGGTQKANRNDDYIDVEFVSEERDVTPRPIGPKQD